jgi:hypothetical protein
MSHDSSRAESPLVMTTAQQTNRLRQEVESAFGLSVQTHATGDESQNCNLLYCRVYLENYPIRDCLFVVNVYGEHALMRFSSIESVGIASDAKERLVAQVNFAVRKAGLTFVYEEAATYALSNAERELCRTLIPETYRKKIENLGIDWSEAN